MGTGLAAIIQPEHALDDREQICGKMNAPDAPAVVAVRMGKFHQLDVEGGAERLDGAGQLDVSLRGTRGLDLQPRPRRKRLDLGEVRSRGPVGRGKFLAAQVMALERHERPDLFRRGQAAGARAHAHGDVNAFVGFGGPDQAGSGPQGASAALEDAGRSICFHDGLSWISIFSPAARKWPGALAMPSF